MDLRNFQKKKQNHFDFCFAPNIKTERSEREISTLFKDRRDEQQFQPLSSQKSKYDFSKRNTSREELNNQNFPKCSHFEPPAYFTPTRNRSHKVFTPNNSNANHMRQLFSPNSNSQSSSKENIIKCEIHQNKSAKYFIQEQNSKHFLCSKCAVNIAMKGGKPVEINLEFNFEKREIECQIDEFLRKLFILESKTKEFLHSFPKETLSSLINELAMMRFDVEENKMKIIEKISLQDFKSIIDDYELRLKAYEQELNDLLKIRLESQESRESWGSHSNSLYFSFDNKESLKSEFFSEMSAANLFNSNFPPEQDWIHLPAQESETEIVPKKLEKLRFETSQTEESDKENQGMNSNLNVAPKKRIHCEETKGKYQKLLDKVQRSQMNTSHLVKELKSSNSNSPSISPSKGTKSTPKISLKDSFLKGTKKENENFENFNEQFAKPFLLQNKEKKKFDFEEKKRSGRTPFQMIDFSSPRFNH